MKKYYFFGCSMTAGDELSDPVFFPWLDEVKDIKDYYSRRDQFFNGQPFKFQTYIEENKKLAYPNIIANNTGNDCVNYATPGDSLRTNVLKIIQLINSEQPKADCIFLQIPPTGREFFFNRKHEFSSIQIASINPDIVNALRDTQLSSLNGGDFMNMYLTAKAMTHSIIQYAIEDFSDLIMVDAYLKSKNIPLILIDLARELEIRNIELQNYPQLQYLVNQVSALHIFKFLEHIADPIDDPVNFYTNNSLLGGHYSQYAHKVMAEKLQKYINE
jgi:hypothetical protein